jgi:hypothetical protein
LSKAKSTIIHCRGEGAMRRISLALNPPYVNLLPLCS